MTLKLDLRSHASRNTPVRRDGPRRMRTLEFDHIVVESLGIEANTAEALGIGYAPKGMMKGYVAIPVRLPTGELTATSE
jgi:hypothetical protein